VFDSDNEPAVRFAYRMEDGFPELWDAEAREELGLEVSDV
jgi:uncharacterized protein YbaR (Trm112 family)